MKLELCSFEQYEDDSDARLVLRMKGSEPEVRRLVAWVLQNQNVLEMCASSNVTIVDESLPPAPTTETMLTRNPDAHAAGADVQAEGAAAPKRTRKPRNTEPAAPPAEPPADPPAAPAPVKAVEPPAEPAKASPPPPAVKEAPAPVKDPPAAPAPTKEPPAGQNEVLFEELSKVTRVTEAVALLKDAGFSAADAEAFLIKHIDQLATEIKSLGPDKLKDRLRFAIPLRYK